MNTFEEHLSFAVSGSTKAARPLAQGECQSPSGIRCSLCHAASLSYDRELTLKNTALRAFWKQDFPPERLSPIVPSPLGRGYRTVTKRKAFRVKESVRLGLIAPTEEGSFKPFEAVQCAIEPDDHGEIYRKIQEALAKPYATPLGDILNYVIIKGSYSEYTLIFNVRKRSPDVIRAANTLSKSLTHFFKKIVGIFLFEDETSGRYYLERKKQTDGRAIRKIHGKSEIYQKICGRSFLYSPMSFSQVNQSILEPFVTTAGELLELSQETLLFDLYSGYGMFALCLNERAGSVIGVEVATESIDSANANARRQKAPNVKFIRNDITAQSIAKLMQHPSSGRMAVLLDPPRSGTAAGVIECIAARTPERVVHIFCNIDIISSELKRWRDNGYTVARVVPFDMFPGTSSIEMMVLLELAQP